MNASYHQSYKTGLCLPAHIGSLHTLLLWFPAASVLYNLATIDKIVLVGSLARFLLVFGNASLDVTLHQSFPCYIFLDLDEPKLIHELRCLFPLGCTRTQTQVVALKDQNTSFWVDRNIVVDRILLGVVKRWNVHQSHPLGQKQRVRRFAPVQGIVRDADHSSNLRQQMREWFCLTNSWDARYSNHESFGSGQFLKLGPFVVVGSILGGLRSAVPLIVRPRCRPAFFSKERAPIFRPGDITPTSFWLGIDNDTPSNLLTLNERLIKIATDQSTPKMLLFQISDHVSDTNAKEA
ncbi:hypothetical protein KCU92_g280, partial [Aureobasidium melanogenum]